MESLSLHDSPHGEDPETTPRASTTSPNDPERYDSLMRVLHHLFLAIARIPEGQATHDPILCYLKAMTRIHFGDLLRTLHEDGKQDWLDQNPKRVETLISFLNLHREMGGGEIGKGQLLDLAERELDGWFEQLGNFAGDWDAEQQATELEQVVSKVKAVKNAAHSQA